MMLACDIETNGLLDELTTCHVLSMTDGVSIWTYHDQKSTYGLADGTMAEGLARLEQEESVWHNGIGFDIPAIKILYPDIKVLQKHDTYILSQMLFANEMQRHGLDAWGKVMGVEKPKHEDWTQLSEEMIHRNREDVRITWKLWERCKKILDAVDLTDAIALEYEVFKVYSVNQAKGWPLYVHGAEHLVKRLTQMKTIIKSQLTEFIPLQLKIGLPLTKVRTKLGLPTHALKTWHERENIQIPIDCFVGPFTRFNFEPINLNSTTQLVKYLLSEGWKPEEYNYQKDKRGRPIKNEYGKLTPTSPKLSGSSFNGINPKIGNLFRKYNVVKHRAGQIQGWVDNVQGGSLPTFAYTCGTNTARYRHAGLVNVPKADKSVFLGRSMRGLFTCPPGTSLVGCDASQLEARIIGHFTSAYDGGKYADFLLTCDVHQFNADIFGTSRADAKAPGYAIEYGCGPKKIDDLLNCGMGKAKQLLKDYQDARPAAKMLKAKLEMALEGRGFSKDEDIYNKRASIRTIDGRPIYVRSWHSLVNSLIQSSGMICVKKAYCLLDKYLRDAKLKYRIVMLYHDEYQIICFDKDTKQVSELAVKAIEDAGKYYKLRIPLAAEAKVGKSWRHTH